MTEDHTHRPIIVGTAGHIDHGKTALIKLLTGVDTDRLKQEKERGISIELGFTALELPSKRVMGVIDVPGHERFIKNMLAGAGGIDLILFVIAADEGVMPQTREHMDIIDLLGVQHGLVALTKVDMVDEDFVDIVQETVQEYISDTGLKNAPIVRVSSASGEGRDDVLKALDDLADRIDLHDRGHLRRLPVDRTFIMEGFGTVVTGTLWAGHLSEGEPVRIVPRGIDTRIKALEVHNKRVPTALAGQRVAVSVHAVEKSAIQRGDWVVAGDGPEPTIFVDARLRVLRSAERPLANSQRVRFHLGAAELLGRVILLDCDQIEPGKQGWAQLRLEEPVLTERGDHFVLRTYSPMHTIAGGTVVTAGVGRRRRHRREDIEALEQAEVGTPEERVRAVLTRRGARGGNREELARESGCAPEEVKQAIETLLEKSQARALGKTLVVAASGYESASHQLQDILQRYQREQPLSWGILKSELKQKLKNSMAGPLIELWVEEQVQNSTLFVRGDRLRIGDGRLDLSPGHAALFKTTGEVIKLAGCEGRRQKEILDEVAARVSGGELGSDAGALRTMPAPQLQKDIEAILLLLVDAGDVVRVPPHFYFDVPSVETLVEKVAAFFKGNQEMKVGDLKELAGVSRKQAIPLLEFLDLARVTQRRGDSRVAGPRLRADREEPTS